MGIRWKVAHHTELITKILKIITKDQWISICGTLTVIPDISDGFSTISFQNASNWHSSRRVESRKMFCTSGFSIWGQARQEPPEYQRPARWLARRGRITPFTWAQSYGRFTSNLRHQLGIPHESELTLIRMWRKSYGALRSCKRGIWLQEANWCSDNR